MSTNPVMHFEAFYLLCNKVIGYGMSRTVYNSKVLSDCVVKVEDTSGKFQNVVEWETWLRVSDTEFAKWFAPCKWISPSGSILVMEKTITPSKSEYPSKMPIFLCDFKFTNYGLIGNKLVCHDYGTNLLFENGMTNKMAKVNWLDNI